MVHVRNMNTKHTVSPDADLPDDQGRLEDEAHATQDKNPGRARVHLVLGPVGAGKSTFARQLAAEHVAVRLTLDEWMTALFSPDRPNHHVVEWYRVRASRSVDLIWELTREIARTGTDVVLEIGLLERVQREAFYRRVDDAGFELRGYVLDAAREVRRERVMARNRTRGVTFSMVVPPEFFELASDAWQPVEVDETRGRDFGFVRTDRRWSTDRRRAPRTGKPLPQSAWSGRSADSPSAT